MIKEVSQGYPKMCEKLNGAVSTIIREKECRDENRREEKSAKKRFPLLEHLLRHVQLYLVTPAVLETSAPCNEVMAEPIGNAELAPPSNEATAGLMEEPGMR